MEQPSRVLLIELKKILKGAEKVDDWIRLLNAATEEELNMIKTKNPGILEAIKEVKNINLRKEFRALHEAKLKEIRDQNASDDYVRAEGEAAGKAIGKAEGEIVGRAKDILLLLEQKGAVPQRVKEAVLVQKKEDILEKWLLLAAGVENVEKFCVKTGL